MNRLKLMFILTVMFFVVPSGYCTDHYVINTTSSVANQTFENYYQTGGYETAGGYKTGGVFFVTSSGTLTILSSSFINNYSDSYGGAIHNDSGQVYIGNGTSFTNNSADVGGAILNRRSQMYIGNGISFTNNSATSGGAIVNALNGRIDIGNYAVFNLNHATDYGGAIQNNAELNIGSYAVFGSNSSGYAGGAIGNTGNLTIEDNAVFTSNTAPSYGGGAIYNEEGTITIGNNVVFSSNTTTWYGGGVYNWGNIIIGNNVIFSSNSANYAGGAIYAIYASTTTISSGAKFTNNSATSKGGAIYNAAILNLTADTNNIKFTSNTSTNGGAIYNSGILNLMTYTNNIEFAGNTASDEGGAICNYGGEVYIGNGTLFRNNTADIGGAIFNNYSAGIIDIGDNVVFNSNHADEYGGAIYNNYNDIDIGSYAVFSSNSSGLDGGAICNVNGGDIDIGNNAVFSSNSSSLGGGAIDNENGRITIWDNAVFSSNSANYGGGIYNCGEVETIREAVFSSNSATYGGAIYASDNSTTTILHGAKFINNSATSKGGAIYNAGELNLLAYEGNIEFSGNTANGISNAIHDNGGIIDLATGIGDIIFNDRITSENNTSIINIFWVWQDSTQDGAVILNADMSGYLGTVNFECGIIRLGNNGTLFNDFIVSTDRATFRPTFDFADSVIRNYSFKNLTVLNSYANLTIDADLKNESMDTISANSYSGIGTINVNKINIITDSKVNNLDIIFTTSTVLKDKITATATASGTLYNYNVLYSTNTGSFNFTRGAVNPIVLEGAVSAIAGGYVTQVNVLGQAFNSIDGFVSNSKISAKKHRNLYASTANQIFESNNKIERGLWIRPYAIQETVKLENTDIDNISYGTLAGLDLAIAENKMISFYLGSTGSKQEYEQVKANQTGYIIGASGMFVKDNYYMALTANAGFNDVNADNDYGTDKFKMMTYSVGAKAGYDIEAGKNWIIQPNLLLMYGIVSTDQYTTSQGARVDSNSTNNIHIEPQVKAKLESENGWTPYGLVSIAFNAGDKTKATTEQTDLESMSFDSYIEYGAGVDKNFIGTSWSGYGQVTGRSGGRNGYGLFAGVKYLF